MTIIHVQFPTVQELLVLVLMAFLIIMIGFWLKSWLRAVHVAFTLPGPLALVLFGNIFELQNGVGFLQLGKKIAEKYGTLCRLWWTIIPFLVVSEPKYLQRILGTTKQINKSFLYKFMHTVVGDGLITNTGNKWKSHRKYIQPYFDINTLSMSIPTFAESAECMVERLRGQKEVKMVTYINRCISDIVHQTILGIPIKEESIKRNSPFTKGNVVMVTDRLFRPWYYLDFFYNFTFSSKRHIEQTLTLQEFSKKMVEERRRDNQLGKVSQWCLLDALMEISENNADFTDQDIIDELCTFMLAGEESVEVAVAVTLYYLAKHPNIQQKVMEEINPLFLTSSTINIEMLSKMKYLEQCIKESMRLSPSVPVLVRELSEDVQLDKHNLPAGCNVMIMPYVTHRLPEYYPDPERFDPDRFSAENAEKIPAYAYIPFSADPRNCLGYKFAMLEIKTVIATLLLNFKFSVVPEYELEVYFRITLRVKGGVQLRLEPRKHEALKN